MKVCTKCKIEKEETEFFFKNKEKKRLHAYCKECKRALDRKLYQDNIGNRRGKVSDLNKKTSQNVKDYIFQYKKTKVCENCGDDRFYVLDFHHLGDKKYEISNMGRSSLRLVKIELNKCITLCANCHRELHYLERINK